MLLYVHDVAQEALTNGDFWVGVITAASVVTLSHAVAVQESINRVRQTATLRPQNVVDFVERGRRKAARNRQATLRGAVGPWASLSWPARCRLLLAYVLYSLPYVIALAGWGLSLAAVTDGLDVLRANKAVHNGSLDEQLVFWSFILLVVQVVVWLPLDANFDFKINPRAGDDGPTSLEA
jgi:hypothetical protein